MVGIGGRRMQQQAMECTLPLGGEGGGLLLECVHFCKSC